MTQKEAERTEEPLRCTRNGKTDMPSPRREDICDVNPRQRTPPQRIEADVDIQHRSHSLARRGRDGGRRVRRGRVDLEEGADDEEQSTHAEGGNDEEHLSTERVDEEEDEDGGGDEFDDAVYTGCEERVGRPGISNLQNASTYQEKSRSLQLQDFGEG